MVSDRLGWDEGGEEKELQGHDQSKLGRMIVCVCVCASQSVDMDMDMDGHG